MIFNNIWTKEVNDLYRKCIREKKTMYEIENILGNKLKYHPEGKFKTGGSIILLYDEFVNEIKFTPSKIDYNVNHFESLFFKGLYDIIIDFNINGIDYVLSLDILRENCEALENKIVYNVAFTTKEQYDKYRKLLMSNIKTKGYLIEKDYIELRDIYEKETKIGDIIFIFKALSYILIMVSKDINEQLGYCIYMIGETNNPKKIKFYKKSIEQSFENYEIVSDYSLYNNNKLTYYYIIGN